MNEHSCACNHETTHSQMHNHSHIHAQKSSQTTWVFSTGSVQVEVHDHEGATAISLDIVLNPKMDLSLPMLSVTLDGIARSVERQGGIVGHIKAYADGGVQGKARMSTVGSSAPPVIDGLIDVPIDDSFRIQIVVIVLAMDSSDVQSIIRSELTKLLKK